MRQRVISSLGGLAVLAVALMFYSTLMLNVFVSLISALALYEVLSAAKYMGKRSLVAICIAFAVIVPFLTRISMKTFFPVICFVFALLLFILLLAKHSEIRIEQIGFSFFVALCISTSMNCIVLMRDRFGTELGMYGLFLTLGSAWISDTGAYFVGSFFGKHKLCPGISPKKTVEGLFGGLVSCLVGNMLLLFLISKVFELPMLSQYAAAGIGVNYLLIALLSPIYSLTGVLGDLSASIIKRQCNIKDFGSIMPGHGGVLDRFDSVLFVAPTVYISMVFLPLFL